MRENVIHGPCTALDAARRLRTGRAERLSDGRVVVTACAEGGVLVQQVSDGVRDALRIVVAGNPLQLDEPTALQLELRWGQVRLLRAPQSATRREVVYEVPLPPFAPRRFRAYFSATRDGQRRRLANGGVGFGRSVPLLFASLDVQLELAREAQRRGEVRPLPPTLEALR
jgi:hypothetical protein